MPRYVGLVVHGIGEQERGSTLKDVGAALADLIRCSGLDREATLHVAPAEESGPAWAEISLRQGHTIRLEEVWWARSFQPPSVQRALRFWLGTFLRNPLGIVSGTFRSLRGERVIFLQRLITEVVAYAAVILFLPLAVVLWFLSVNPLRRFLPKAIQTTYELVANVLTRHVGDLSVYLDDDWEAARIQEVFASGLKSITGQEADERFVIAHSMGAVVAYEGLLRAHGAKHPAVRFIAVGAALNRARRMVWSQQAYRLKKRLPGWVRLTYIAARHDPVTLGDLEPSWDKWAANRRESLEVVNQQDIFSDHTTYWSNAEEVMAPILGMISGGRLSVQLRKGCRRLRVTVLAALKGVAWLVPAAIFVWMAATNWSESFAAWAYGKAVLQTPVRMITQSPQTATAAPSTPTPPPETARVPEALVMAPIPGAPLIAWQAGPSIAIDAIPGGQIDGRRAVTSSEPFEVAIVIEAVPEIVDGYRYYGYRYLLTWDQPIIAFDGASELRPDDLTQCEKPEPSESSVSGGCDVSDFREGTSFEGPVTMVQVHCVADGESQLDLVGVAEDERGTALRVWNGELAEPDLTLGRPTIFCQVPPTATSTPTGRPTEIIRATRTRTPTVTATPTPTRTATATAIATVTATPEVTPCPPGCKKEDQNPPSLKPWDEPNDFMTVLGGRWTLEHLALPLLAAAYVAGSVGVVYNLLVKTLWDLWDRRTKFRPAPPGGVESVSGVNEGPEARP